MRSRAVLAVVTVVLLTAAGCGQAAGPATSPPSAATSSSTSSSGSPSTVASTRPPYTASTGRSHTAATSPSRTATTESASSPPHGPITKLLVFMVENHSASEMAAQMPFTAALAHRYGFAADATAITHPSLPNYLAIAGGDTFGISDDNPPAAHPISGASVFGAAIHHGSTARLYADAMDSPCQTAPAREYAVKHNPWAYFHDEASLCRRDDLPLSAFQPAVAHGALPAVGMVIPDLCHDAHDCPLAQADDWLRTQVSEAMSGPDWASGHLAIVITADEDDDAHGNHVLTVVAQPSLHHVVDTAPVNHYALSRAYADVAGVAPLRHAAEAPDLLRGFGLTTR